MKQFLFSLLLALGLSLISCRPSANPNEWIVTTTTCWNDIHVLKAGEIMPKLFTVCDRAIVLPATELAAEFEVEAKFKGRLAGTVQMTYQWAITDPETFIHNAKSVTSSPTSSGHKIDPDHLELVENTVVDKMLKDVIREYTPSISPDSIDELEMETVILSLAQENLGNRGVGFFNISVNVTLPPQAEEALATKAALEFYRANNMEELGKKIIEAKAGAPTIIVETVQRE